jgi:hypothetical protein
MDIRMTAVGPVAVSELLFDVGRNPRSSASSAVRRVIELVAGVQVGDEFAHRAAVLRLVLPALDGEGQLGVCDGGSDASCVEFASASAFGSFAVDERCDDAR